MMKWKITLIACSLVGLGFAQGKIQIYSGAVVSKLQFPGFQTFVDSYNAVNQQSSTYVSDLKFDPLSKGWYLGGFYTIGHFVSGINGGQLYGNHSVAEFAYDQRRIFQFRGYNFDVQVGGCIGGEKHGLTPYVSMSINTLNLHSWYEYGDLRSYGGETQYSGVWTSWRLVYLAGLRYTYSRERWGIFLDCSYQINEEEYLGGDFSESNSATDSQYFKATATQSTVDAITGGLKENYRQIKGSFGITIQLNKP